jgi:hypothetical protein
MLLISGWCDIAESGILTHCMMVVNSESSYYFSRNFNPCQISLTKLVTSKFHPKLISPVIHQAKLVKVTFHQPKVPNFTASRAHSVPFSFHHHSYFLQLFYITWLLPFPLQPLLPSQYIHYAPLRCDTSVNLLVTEVWSPCSCLPVPVTYAFPPCLR